MIIYKITNKINGRMYIGQTINSLEERWRRHCNDALNNVLDTHFARAIRKYGPDNFIAEIIDIVEDEEDLTPREQYWIRYYDALHNGYNETDATYKSGGNTYQNKTTEEMEVIKQKIRESKLGGKNPQATSVKCKNIRTNEEYHFASQSEMQKFFNESNHQFCSRRCLGQIKCLYKNEWLIAYENAEYPVDYSLKGTTKRKGREVVVTDYVNKNTYYFHSLREAEDKLKDRGYSHCSRQVLSAILKGQHEQYKDFIIEYAK